MTTRPSPGNSPPSWPLVSVLPLCYLPRACQHLLLLTEHPLLFRHLSRDFKCISGNNRERSHIVYQWWILLAPLGIIKYSIILGFLKIPRPFLTPCFSSINASSPLSVWHLILLQDSFKCLILYKVIPDSLPPNKANASFFVLL